MPIDRKYLDDREKYPDTLKVTDPTTGFEMTLGDLREFESQRAEEANQWKNRAAGVEGQYGNLANQYNELKAQLDNALANQQNLTTDPNTIVDLLISKLTGGRKTTVLDQPGEFFEPVIQRLKELDDIKGQLETLKTTQQQEFNKAMAFQVAKDMKRDYRSMEWPKEMTFEKAIQYAQQNGLVERDTGYPDFDRIHETVMGPIRAQENEVKMAEKYRQEGYEKARGEMASSSYVPNPGFGGAPELPKPKYGGIDKVSEADILNDAEIWTANIRQ